MKVYFNEKRGAGIAPLSITYGKQPSGAFLL